MSRALALAILFAVALTSAGCGAFDVGRTLALCTANPRDCN